MATLFEALGWIEAERGAPPPFAIVRPTATRQDANLAVVKAFFAQSSLAMEGFDVGGVLPFWVSGGIMPMQSLQSVASDRVRHALEHDPRALLIKSDPGTTSCFISGIKKYFVGIVDAWLPEEPCSRQSLKPFKSWSIFCQSWSSLPSKIWLPGIVFRTFRKSETPREREIPCCLSLSLSLVCPLPTCYTGQLLQARDVEIVNEGVRVEQCRHSCLGHEKPNPPLSGAARF